MKIFLCARNRHYLLSFFVLFLFVLITFAFQLSFAQAQFSLTDTWELYNRAGGGPPVGGIFMNITHTGDIIKASGNDWTGEGKFNSTTKTGYYNWEFTDGKTGTTTFTYNPEYDMIYWGAVSGSGIDWEYIGRRNSKPMADFSGSYKNDGPNLSILIMRQTGNKVDIFFNVSSSHHYGSGYVVGNIAIVDYVRIAEQGVDLSPTGSGKYYFFISNDLQKIWQRKVPFDPPLEGPSCCGNFTREPATPVFSSPAGWIGLDGKQSCIQSGSGGLRLSCQSPDDFEESGYCMDPRTMQLINYWLSKAKPFWDWDKAWYDCWGRWVGTSRNGETRGNCHRPETDGKTRCEYVLEQLRGSFPNVDTSVLPAMDLEAYLIRKLTGK